MANIITLFRCILIFAILYILTIEDVLFHLLAIVLTLILVVLDAVDGIVARVLNEESELGGVFDIVVDRIVENCFWIFFSSIGVISFWIPCIVISRGFIVDGIRSTALASGMTAFGSKTLQQTPLGKFLVASKTSRGIYGFLKTISFISLIIIDSLHYPQIKSMMSSEWRAYTVWVCLSIVYTTVAVCVIRGIPVILEGRALLSSKTSP